MRSPYTVSWVRSERASVALLYDTSRGSLDYILTDYCLYLQGIQALSKTTIENEIWHVVRFLAFIRTMRIALADTNDELLTKFRDTEFNRVLRSSRSRGSELKARATVNARLRRTYDFLQWASQVDGIAPRLIGPRGCNVTALLGASRRVEGRPGYRQKQTSRERYPLLFRQTARGSKHATGHFATEEVKRELENYFFRTSPSFIAHRNVLIMELADALGWRRGSINSLTCSQFQRPGDSGSEPMLDLRVTPKRQKFGYDASKVVPFRLVARVRDFIRSHRRHLLSSRGWSDANAHDALFVSSRNGQPLSDQTISQIFGDAFKAIGAPAGAGLHSFRRKYGDDQVELEIEVRRELGLDTSASSVSASVSQELGHRNPESLYAYVSRAQGRRAASKTSRFLQQIEELQHEVRQLRNATKVAAAHSDFSKGISMNGPVNSTDVTDSH